MKKQPVTGQPAAILAWIKRYHRRYGETPMQAEIADHFGLSRPTIHAHIERLVAAGHLRRRAPRKYRNLRLVGTR